MRTYLLVLVLFAGIWSTNALSYEEFTKINSTEAVAEIRQYTSLTDAQKQLVAIFRKQNSKHLKDDYLSSDTHIIGLLKASRWDLANAARYLKNILSWRRKNKVDEIGLSTPPADLIAKFPFRANGTTKDGCPILEIDWGKWKVADFLLSKEFIRDSLSTYNRHQINMWESGRLETKKKAPRCDQALILADIGGFEMKNLAAPNGVGSVVRMATTLETYFHNLYTTIICFKSPPDFTTLMTILQPYLGSTADAFNFYSESDKDVASKHALRFADPDQLSPDYAAYFTSQ